MKILRIIWVVFISMALPAAVAAGQDAVLLLAPETQGAGSGASLDKFKADMAARGVAIMEMPEDEVQDVRQAALAGGAATVVTLGGKTELKAYDTVTGKDISKTFYAEQVAAQKKTVPVEPMAAVVQAAPAPVVVQVAEAPKPVEKPVVQAATREKPSFVRNHIGLSMGPSTLAKNKDSLEILQQGNPGTEITYTKTSGRFQFFYERGLSEKYTLGFSAEFEKGGDARWDNHGRTLFVTRKQTVGNVYLTRNFGKHFGLSLGGGAGAMALRVDDQDNMAGINYRHDPFSGDLTTAHAEADMALSAGNFSLRFSLRKIFAVESGQLTTVVNGAKYRLTVKNGKTLSYKPEGQPLGVN